MKFVRHDEGCKGRKTEDGREPSPTNSHGSDAIQSTEVVESCGTTTGRTMMSAAVVAIGGLLYFILLGFELLRTSAKIVGVCATGQELEAKTRIAFLMIIGILATVAIQLYCSATPPIVVPLVGSETVGGWILAGIVALCFFIGFVFVGLELLSQLGAQSAGNLLVAETNPIALLLIGMLGTVLLQSSSITASTVIYLVGSGTIGARQAIYMVMGANVGTSIASTIVALGYVDERDKLERAVAGATMPDVFNLLTVAALLPVEMATGFLYYLTEALVSESLVRDGEKWDPIKRFVAPLAANVIKANDDIIKGVANGGSCDSFYPISCQDPSNPTKNTCTVGLIDCDHKTNKCPVFFRTSTTKREDEIAGAVSFFLALVMLLVCLHGLVTILQKILVRRTNRLVHKTSSVTAMAAGTAITTLVQSSSITTAIVTPFVGTGVISLKQMLPMALGANLGNTVTILLASLASKRVASLQVALAYLSFNVAGILMWYSISFMRRIPLDVAGKLGRMVHVWRGFPFLYIVIALFLPPLGLVGLAGFREGEAGAKHLDILGSVIVVLLAATTTGILTMMSLWWCRRRGSVDSLRARPPTLDNVGISPEVVALGGAHRRRRLVHAPSDHARPCTQRDEEAGLHQELEHGSMQEQ